MAYTRNVLTGIGLLGLLALTVGLAYAPLGPWGVVVALLIAAAKAGLIAVVFMQLSTARGITRLFAASGLFWFALMLGLTLVEILGRGLGSS